MLAVISQLTVALSVQNLPVAPPGFRHASEVEVLRLGPPSDEDVVYEASIFARRIRIETSEAYEKRLMDEYKKRSSSMKLKIPLANATAWWSPGVGVKVSNGWIAGWDAGEFGGGLFWISLNGDSYRTVDRRNTQIVAQTPNGVYAFQALNHLKFSYSRFVKVVYERGEWRTQLVTDLHDCPQAILFDNSRFYYVGTRYVSTMELDGTQRLVYRWQWPLVTRRLVVSEKGDLWLGTARAVLCLSSSGNGGFKPFWFRPIAPKKSPDGENHVF